MAAPAPNLAELFGKPGDAAPTDDAAPDSEASPDDSAETDQALNDSIDEVFSAKDPVARQEAFKRAVGLCKDSSSY